MENVGDLEMCTEFDGARNNNKRKLFMFIICELSHSLHQFVESMV